MTLESDLHARSNSKCELCGGSEELSVYEVPPYMEGHSDQSVLVCSLCLSKIEDPPSMDAEHWRCLKESMWSQVPAVQVLIWRLLTQMSGEGWSRALLDMLYLDNDLLLWAEAKTDSTAESEERLQHIDVNGAVLQAGDKVSLTKDLVVKGAGFTAKRGTLVRNISLVSDNVQHIEGRVNGQQIVILTKFAKKSN